MELATQVLPLALLDTLSVSTLAIPVWFLLTPKGLRVGNVLLYLFLVGGAYLVLGLLLMGVLDQARPLVQAALRSPAGDLGLALVGGAFLLAALWHGFRRVNTSREGRLTRWRDASVGRNASIRGLLTVALTAVLFEIATMFPYLLALDILADAGVAWSTGAAVLALYCLIMITPALIATLILMFARTLVRPVLVRVDRWLRDNAQENTAWLLAIVGFLMFSNSTYFGMLMNWLSG